MRLKNAIHASTYIRGYPMLTLYIVDVERDVGMKNLSREEAEKVLEGMKVKIEISKAAVTQWKRNTALDMAIKALKHSEVPNSSDCISRQAAIDALGEKPLAWLEGEYELGLQNQWENDVDAIKALLPAQPKTGHWMYTTNALGDDIHVCSVCGKLIKQGYLNFCANCGAKMKPVDELVDEPVDE